MLKFYSQVQYRLNARSIQVRGQKCPNANNHGTKQMKICLNKLNWIHQWNRGG